MFTSQSGSMRCIGLSNLGTDDGKLEEVESFSFRKELVTTATTTPTSTVTTITDTTSVTYVTVFVGPTLRFSTARNSSHRLFFLKSGATQAVCEVIEGHFPL